MRTEKQKEASRRNGAQSHGPVTPEGKQRSSMNALTHGLTAESDLALGEDRAGFDRLFADLRAQCPPPGPREYMLLHQMARAYWRLERGAVAEDDMVDKALAAQPPADGFANAMSRAFTALAAQHEFALVQRYLTRNERSLQRFFYCHVRAESAPAPTPPPPVLPNEPEPDSTPVPSTPSDRDQPAAPPPPVRLDRPGPRSAPATTSCIQRAPASTPCAS